MNSITDNPRIGDERNFVRIREKDVGEYGDYIRVKPGDRLQFSVFVSNDAADNLDGSAATIHGLTADFYFPAPGKDVGLLVTLSGKNVADVWDGVTVLSDEPVRLNPVKGSMKMFTNAGTFPINFGDRLTKVTLGWDKPDGEYPVGYSNDGKYRGTGYLDFELAVNKAG